MTRNRMQVNVRRRAESKRLDDSPWRTAINAQLGIRDEQYPVGSAAFGIPRPVLYVIDREGTVRLRYMEPTYRTRPDLDAVLADVRELGL